MKTLKKIKQALTTLFENDESSARPSGIHGGAEGCVVYAIIRKGGQYSSAKVHRAVNVTADGISDC